MLIQLFQPILIVGVSVMENIMIMVKPYSLFSMTNIHKFILFFITSSTQIISNEATKFMSNFFFCSCVSRVVRFLHSNGI